jgi:hypothetical protein
LEYVNVPTVSANEAVGGSLLLKIDAEGSELKILSGLSGSHWVNGLICFFEISSPANRQPIYDFLTSQGISLHPQKNCWNPAKAFSDLPGSWREGNCMAFLPTELNKSIHCEFMNTSTT